MSASYVRHKIEQWCAEVSQVTGIPFYTTINEEIHPTDNVWFTVEYLALFIEGMICKKDYVEQGAARLVFVSRPGIGWEEAILAMEAVVPLIFEKVDPSRRLEIESYEPPQEDSVGSADPQYIVSTALNYVHRL